MHIYVNPGSGPVLDSTEAEATRNMKQFVLDLAESGVTSGEPARCPKADEDGRFGFELYVENAEGRRRVEILMPGIQLERVRYLGLHQNMLDFPRLYVNGASWFWMFAVDAAIPRKKGS